MHYLQYIPPRQPASLPPEHYNHVFIRLTFPPSTSFRTRRQSDYDNSFSREINDCDSDRCTLMRCTVGPMARDDIVTFKIRSRLFTETQIKVRLLTWPSLQIKKPRSAFYFY